jgi:starch phosphorylase
VETSESQRVLPPPFERLWHVANDLRLSSSKTLQRVWSRIDADAWERSANARMILEHASSERLAEVASDAALTADLARKLAREDAFARSAGWFDEHHAGEVGTIAYFSMEFGLSEALPIYSGGLGMLAGDHLKSASDLKVPVVGVGLLYQQGYFRQVLGEDGRQLEAMPFNEPGSLPVTPEREADGRAFELRLELPGRDLVLRVWRAKVGAVPLFLLDSNHPLNSPWDRGITANLYDAGREKRLLQELVLGVGGWRLLERLGLEIDVCHLNEGHAAFAVLARAASFAARREVPFAVALRATRAGNVFTTHTPVDAAFDRFDPALVKHYVGPFIRTCGLSDEAFFALGRTSAGDAGAPFNMAYLALRGSCHANGVSRLHGRVSRRLFQPLFPGWPAGEVPVGHVTNGVHVPTWHSELATRLWSSAVPGEVPWLARLEDAERAVAGLSDEALWDYRAQARQALVSYVRRRHETAVRQRGATPDAVQAARHRLDPNVLTIGFARRFTSYKRPALLLTDERRLARILNHPERAVQLVMAGKAHPNDEDGKAVVQRVARFAWREDVRDRVVFLEDYDMLLAQHLAGGVDVWLNNPRRPAEACGTSGMKMLVNGGLHCSSLDGWWDEAFTPEVGWAIGDDREHGPEEDGRDADALYELLEGGIVPEFYDRDAEGVPRAWIRRIRASMTRLTARFSSDRMVREYVESAYVPAARAYRRRAADDARIAREIEDRLAAIDDGWAAVRFGRVSAEAADGGWDFRVQAYLGELPPDAVEVQLYAEEADGHPCELIATTRTGAIHGAVNGHAYGARVPAKRPAQHYTPRIVSRHPDAWTPAETGRVLWWRA